VSRRFDLRRSSERTLHAAEQLFRTAFENAPVGMALVGLDGRFLRVNRALCTILGYDEPGLLALGVQAITHPADVQAELALHEQLIAGASESYTLQNRYLHARGRPVWVELHVALVRDDAGEPLHSVAQIRDIDAHKAAEAHLAEDLFRGAFEHAPIGVALVAADGPHAGCIVRANHALAELVGGDPAQLAGRALSSLAPAEARPELAATLARLIDGAESVSGEQQLIDAEGHDVWTLLSGSLVQSPQGENGRQAVIQVLDISDRKTFEGRLQHLADHDTLTGLFNRRRFEQELNRSLAHAVRYGSRGALLLLDLDGFKYINDVLGHSVGDELILRVGAVLKGTLRETDIVARIGGDEFAAILPEADAQTAALVAGKLLSAIRRRGSVMSEQREARVTTSIGVTVFDGYRGLTAEDLFVEADIAMYEAKDAGRDGAKIFASEERSREAINVRATWLERLRTAVSEDRLRLFAQPIVGFGDADGDVPWFELLLRYEDQYGDLIPPGAFLSIAERFDLITEIDRWVLGEAVRMLHDEHSAGYDVTLAVNLSGKTMDDPGLGDYLASLIAARPIDPGRLVIEVTETAAIVNIERARRLAQRLHALGCRLALDDFGAGFSSFYYLKHLAFDYLKIDGEFVRHLAHDTTDQLVIEAVVNIARALGTKTVAEFVGDEGTVDLLRRLGVDYGQGYHLGRPVPVGDVLPAARLGARRA
jgi:diguanylate cyclase (GGDEF)-like protein/PAS domain S-box-containing protein